MNELDKLYKLLIREGYYSKSYDEFINKYENDSSYQEKVFDVMSRDGFYSKTKEEFLSKYQPQQDTVKKKEDSEVTSQTADTVSPTQQAVEESISVESLPEETPRVSRIEETGEYLAPSAYMPEGRKLVPVQEKEPAKQQELSDIESIQDDSMLVQEKDYTFTDTVGPEKSDKADVSTLAEKQIQNDIYKQEQELRYKELTGGKTKQEQREIKRKQLESQKDTDQFNEALYLIDDYLLNDEETAAADFNKAFDQSGFYFGEEKAFRNALGITSADGEKIIVEYGTAGLTEEAAAQKLLEAEKKIKDFVSRKRIDSEIAQDISRGVKTGESIAKERNLLTKRDYEKEEKEWKSKLSNFQSGVDEYKKMVKSLSSFEPETEQDAFIYYSSVEKLNALSEKLKKEGEDIVAATGEHDALVGRYIDYEGDKWDWGSLALRTVSTGVANMMAAGGRIKADASEMLSKWVGSLSGSEEFASAGKMVSEMTRADIDRKKSQFQKSLDYLGTTSEAVAKLQESSIVARGIIGGLQSAPAMILAVTTGVGGLTLAAAGLQTYESLDEEFKHFKGFEELPIEEKIAVKGAISLAVGWLERLGINYAISRTGLVSQLIRKATKDLPNDASEFMINNAFKREASKLVKFLSKKGKQTVALGEAMAVTATLEGFTGSSQEAVETGVKYAYNKAKKLEVFKTPETFTEFLGNVGTAGVEEMIGSIFLGGTGHVVRAYSNNKIKELPSESFEIFNKMSSDENFSSMFSDALKIKIINKEISKEEAQKQLDNYHEAKSLLKEIPKDYTSNQRKEAFELLSEKKKKESLIQGISPALAFPVTEEIKKIDEQLKSISSKTDSDYVQDKIEVLESERKKAEAKQEEANIEERKKAEAKQEEANIEERLKSRDKKLFTETQEFGPSGKKRTSKISDITTKDGVQTATYSSNKGDIDVIISSTGNNQNYVGYYRVYEDGKPTNTFTSKMQVTEEGGFGKMMRDAKEKLPKKQKTKWTEVKSISKDGLRVWNKSKRMGWKESVDPNGNVITQEVSLNKAKKGKEESDFGDVSIKEKESVEEIKKIKELYPGINARWEKTTQRGPIKTGKIVIELPVLEEISATETAIPEGKKKAAAYTAEEVVEIGDDRIEEFVASQAEAKAQRSDDALQDTPLTVEGVRKIKADGGKLFMTSDGKSGGYVTKDGYMGGLFKQPNSGRRGAAKVLQEARIKAGGKFFEAFGVNQKTGEGTTLEQIYIENGFRPVARMTFNPEIAPEGWEGTNLKSRPDNVFFVYDPNGQYKAGDGVRIEDYNQAYELAKNQANETKTETKPSAGNRLFNEPLKAVKEIANRYHERVFGKPRKEFQGTRELDVERAKRISDAFEAMKNDPNNPEVRKAYESLAKETIEQYKDFVDAGYVVEINNEEPYANSGEMIDDLRNNKKIKIFSTESGFGDNAITEEQRAENPLLARTEFTDANGVPMLVNDLFRAIHDFYGHAELGNSFGPKGEENAWNVHARMFSPLARRAMTTETRGQNSWVNFSGANDKIKALREEARRLREEGAPEEQVQKIVDEIYEIGSFADQKIGLMPEEFTKLDEEVEAEVESEQVQQEAEDLKSMIDSKSSKVDFRLKKQEDNQTRNDEAEDIVDEMNKIESESKDINIEAESSESKIDVEELNKRTDNPLETVSLEVINGVPAIFNITDQLTTGDVKNTFTGRIIDKLKGAIGFNGTKGNENAAWASVTKEKANSAIKKAIDTYNKNKEFFDDWWAKNPQYKGLVPMNIVKMGENGILSNEALGRVIADNMSKIPSSNKKRALNAFKLRLESQVKKIKSKPDSKITKGDKDVLKVYEIIFSKNSFKSIEQIFNKEFYSSMSLPYRAIVVKNITTGSVNKPNETKKGGKPISGTVAAVLLDGQPDKNNLMFHLGTISDMISDNQLKNIDINNIVSIVGVDVINPDVLNSNHPNYPYSIKGKSIGVLSNPVPLQNAYPTVWAKATSKILDKIKKKQNVQINNLISQSTGVGIGIPNKEYVGIKYEENIKNLNKLVNFMNIAFPGVSVFTDSKSFDNIINSEGVKTYLKGDEIIYGVTVDGDIYINPEVHDSSSELFNTAIHEMGHVWTDYLKTTKKGKEIYKRGAELVSKTEEFKKQLKIFNGDVDAAVNETMSILIGNRGQTISDSAINSNFKEWLIGVWEYVRDKFKMSKDITAEEIQDMTLDQFLGTAMADIFSGSEIKLSKVQQKQMKNLGAAFKKNQSMQSIIKEGRQNGFSDESIRVVLKDRGFKASDITSALEVNIDLVTLMPKEFGNIEGGALLGKKLFNETKQELDRFSKEGPRGGIGKTRTKTFSEIREKAMEIIKSNPIYQNQTNQVQMELLNSFDRALGIKTNAEVTSELKKIRTRLREQKVGAKNLADAQRRMRTIIRKSIPKSKNYSNSSINKLISIVNQTNEKNFKGKSELVLNEIEKQRGVIKNIIVDKIASIVKQKGKVTKTKSGKIRGKGVDAIGQSYFAQANKVLSLIKKNDLEGLTELQNEINQDVLSEIMDKIDRGEQITVKERILADKQLAIDAFSDVMFMDLEQVEQLLEDVKLTRRESIARLNNRREARRAQNQKVKDDFESEIKKNHSQLYNEDGTLIGKNQSDAQKESIWNSFKNNGTYKALTDVYKKILKKRKYSVNSITKFMRNNISHLGTVTNILDRGTDGMFTKIYYNQLNDMSEKALSGTYDKFDVLNGMVSSLKKPKKEWRKWKLSLGEGVMKVQLFEKEGTKFERTINKDMGMRIYALSKNEIQRKKLKSQGINEAQLEQIKTFIGEDNIAMADMVVDYLSNTYFDEVNDIYIQANDVSLRKVDNYFPTKTISKSSSAEAMVNGDFSKIFTAENAPALKDRVDVSGEVDLADSFTSVLENHLEQMERYKAYALGVKQMNEVLKLEDIQSVLRETGLGSLFNQHLNYAINPNSGPKVSDDFISKTQRAFTGFALAFKPIQVLKQATSFVQAYEDYSYFPDNKVPVLDALGMAYDYAKVLARLPSEIKESKKISGTFRKRLEEGMKGDIQGLESGNRVFKKPSERKDKIGTLGRAFNISKGFFTSFGDIAGVVGYKAVYNRNIKNGMSKDQAVRLFNNFNTTQQTRRDTEKIGMQQNADVFSRFFTMFGSTVYLQMNKVASSMNNIVKDIGRGQTPKAKDIRAFALNYSIANVLFTAASYSAVLLSGDDEEKQEAYSALLKAALGLNLIFQIPIIGAAAEVGFNKWTQSDSFKEFVDENDIPLKKSKYTASDGVNPLISVYRKINKQIKKTEEGNEALAIGRVLFEIGVGAQMDTPLGIINAIGDVAKGEEIQDDDFYDALGISASYRPGYGTRKSKPKETKTKKLGM